MDYQEELNMDSLEFECCLRDLIKKTNEFQELYPNLEMTYSKEEQEALNRFKDQHGNIYEQIKVEVAIEFAFITLNRRCNIELYKRLKLPFAKDYEDTEDVISVCSDEDLITLINLINKINPKERNKNGRI